MIRVCAMTLLLAAATLPAGCNNSDPGSQAMPTADIAAVIAEHAPALMQIPGVVGVAEGRTEDGRTCLRIYVVKLDDELQKRLPDEVEGFPVEIEAGGEFKPLH